MRSSNPHNDRPAPFRCDLSGLQRLPSPSGGRGSMSFRTSCRLRCIFQVRMGRRKLPQSGEMRAVIFGALPWAYCHLLGGSKPSPSGEGLSDLCRSPRADGYLRGTVSGNRRVPQPRGRWLRRGVGGRSRGRESAWWIEVGSRGAKARASGCGTWGASARLRREAFSRAGLGTGLESVTPKPPPAGGGAFTPVSCSDATHAPRSGRDPGRRSGSSPRGG